MNIIFVNMNKNYLKILMFLFVLINFGIAQISYTYPQIRGGLYPIATTNLTHDNNKIDTIINAGGNVGEYWEGRIEGNKYISNLLPDSSTAIQFEIIVPNDTFLYGICANSTIQYIAVICYPTKTDNSNEDYILPGNFKVSKMQDIGESPLFYDSDTKYPLIIYSHGKGCHLSNMLPEMENFASMGQIVAGLYFGDKRFQAWAPPEFDEAQEFALRPLAVSKLIDYLENDSNFKDHINFEKIGAYGSSYGGATNVALLGGKIIDYIGGEPSNPTSWSSRITTEDNRIKCAAGIVPWFGTLLSPFWGVYNNGVYEIERPFMALAGENDDGNDFSYIQDAVSKMSGEKYLIRFNKMGHELGEGAGEDYYSWINMFFEAYLNNNDSAYAGLHEIRSFEGCADDILIAFQSPVIPEMIFPETNSELDTNTIELQWNFSNEVTHFELEISDDGEFSNLLISEYEYKNVSYIFQNLEDNKTYFWRLKGINDIGESDWTEIRTFCYSTETEINKNNLPILFSLKQNYPNPFNPTTQIEFQIAKPGLVLLEIYNISGQKIKTLINDKMNIGTHIITFDGAHLTSGIYFYKLKSQSFSKIKKCLLVK